MNRKTVAIAAFVIALGIGGLGGGVVAANGSDDNDQPLSGTTLERATEAALAHTGGGEVVETEVGDDGAAYDVEVRIADGSVVEVNLDSSFRVTGQEADDDGPNDEDGANDD